MLAKPPAGSSDATRAAGGIVWLGSEHHIAVVHRTAHKDCVLPKGKVEPGETAREAAIREVQEETGYKASIGEFVGAISYEVNGRPKVVHFWHMEAGSQSRAPLKEEVDRVEWLPPKRAIEKLTYPLERLLVEVSDQKPRTPRRRQSWRRWLPRPVSSIARLRQSISSHRPELEQRIQGSAASDAIDNHWAKSALMFLDHAKEAADEDDADTGWRCFKAATRMELFGLDGADGRIRATQLVEEGRQKLRGWRKEALLQLLLSGEQLKSDLSPNELAEAARLLHESQDNEYRRIRIRRDQFIVLGFMALALLPAFAFLLWIADIALDVRHPGGILQIAVLGCLGAAISGILRIGNRQASARIPEELSGFQTLLSRLVVGAAMAVFLVALWQSGFLQLPPPLRTSQFAIALAFAAGFSERFAQNAVERLASAGGN